MNIQVLVSELQIQVEIAFTLFDQYDESNKLLIDSHTMYVYCGNQKLFFLLCFKM